MAHALDPDSSHLAASRMAKSGKASTHEAHVLTVVRGHPNLTAAEIAEYLHYDVVEVRRRLSGLKRSGDVIRGTSRFCNVAGTHAVIWRAV